MGESMTDSDEIVPTEKEIAMIRSLRSDPSLADAFEQLARIARDKDPDCYSADDAEEKIHALGERIKLSSMTNWAQNAADGEAASHAARPKAKRSKKNA